MMPESLLTELDYAPWCQLQFALADGRKIEYGQGTVNLRIGDHELPCQVIFGPDNEYLLGASTLEIFNLMVDPMEGQLVPKRYRARPI